MIRLVILAALLAPAAAAHGDVPSLMGPWQLDAGETIVMERPMHWHRVLGSLQADGRIEVLVDGIQAGTGSGFSVNHLARCCDAMWSDMAIEIRNLEDRPVEVEGHMAVLHDNLAVLADDAEPGGWWQTLVIVGLIVGVSAWRAHQPALPASARWLRASRRINATVWIAGGILALVGMVRYGSGPLVGSLGATSGFPMDVGGFFSAHSLLMLVLMAIWGTAYGLWAGARRRGAAGPDGAVFASGALLIGLLMVVEFGGWISLAMGVVPAAAILVDHQAWRWPSRALA